MVPWPGVGRSGCVLVGHEHQRLSEGVRAWLLGSFEFAFIVGDATSLAAGAAKLQPQLVVLDVALPGRRLGPLLVELRKLAPRSRALVLSDYEDPRIDALILSAGADGVVHTTELARDLSPAVDAVLAGRRFGAPRPLA